MCGDFKCKYREPDGLCHYEPSENAEYGCIGEDCDCYSDCALCNDNTCLNRTEIRI